MTGWPEIPSSRIPSADHGGVEMHGLVVLGDLRRGLLDLRIAPGGSSLGAPGECEHRLGLGVVRAQVDHRLQSGPGLGHELHAHAPPRQLQLLVRVAVGDPGQLVAVGVLERSERPLHVPPGIAEVVRPLLDDVVRRVLRDRTREDPAIGQQEHRGRWGRRLRGTLARRGGLGRDRDARRHEPAEAQRGQAGGEEIGFW